MEELTKEEKANGINSERNWLLRNEGVKHVPGDERKVREERIAKAWLLRHAR